MRITVNQTNTWLDECEQIERALDRAGSLLEQDSALAFETCHRAALATAGVVRARANAERKRPLPINAWSAIARLGTLHKVRAAQVQPYVQFRARHAELLAGRVEVDPAFVRSHIAESRQYLAAVRSELMGEIAAAS